MSRPRRRASDISNQQQRSPPMSTTTGSFWTPVESPSIPFPPFESSFPHHGPPSTHPGPPSHASTGSWGSSRGISSLEMPMVNDQSMYPTTRGESTGFGAPSTTRRQTAFVHGAYVDATYLRESATSSSLNPMQSPSEFPELRAQPNIPTRSDCQISPSGTATDFFGPQTGHSMSTDPGYMWASEENPSVRDSSLQSYSVQSLSPALSTDQNLLRSPKHEEEDSDSSPKRSASTLSEGRKKPRRKTHNAIEKRYRVKLNEKIAELRDSIPSLRQQVATTPGGSPIGEPSMTDCTAAQKINKANILEKATEYVRHLENCNRRLQSELHQARAEARPHCQHPSHSTPQSTYASHPSGHEQPYGFETGPPRQGQSDGFFSVEDFFPDDVRQI